MTRHSFTFLVAYVRAQVGITDLTPHERELLQQVRTWARKTGASEERVIEEIRATLEPERPVNGFRPGRGVLAADIEYHGAPVNEN